MFVMDEVPFETVIGKDVPVLPFCETFVGEDAPVLPTQVQARIVARVPARGSSRRIDAVLLTILEGADMGEPRIEIPKEKIAEFCRRHRIRKLSLFGSVLRDDFTDDSDIDVLVEFEEGAKVGWEFFGMQQELSELLGREVELHTKGFLSPYFRDEVIREADVQYDAT
jgi:uncharacterized protein